MRSLRVQSTNPPTFFKHVDVQTWKKPGCTSGPSHEATDPPKVSHVQQTKAIPISSARKKEPGVDPGLFHVELRH